MIRVYLGQGASGVASVTAWAEGLRRRGFEALPLALPVRRAEDAVAAFEAQVPDPAGAVIGGQSYGARVASLAAADATRRPGYAALVCISYPLHRPGAPETADARTAHWPRIRVPALLLSGTADPFARIDRLEAAMPLLPAGRLVTYPRLGHSLQPVAEDVLDRIVDFLSSLDPAARA